MEAPGRNGRSDTGTRARRRVTQLLSGMDWLPHTTWCNPPTSGSPPSLPPRVDHLLDQVFLKGAEVVAITRGGG